MRHRLFANFLYPVRRDDDPHEARAVTRYREIADDLRRRILQGDLRAGERLPSEAALATWYGASRGAIRNALASLARRGIASSRPGSGWYVDADFRTQEFAQLRSFSQWARARGMVPGGRVLEAVHAPADAAIARQLRVRAGEQLLRVTRLRTLDGAAVMIERTVYAPWVAPIAERIPHDEPSVTAALEREGVRMASGTHRLDTVAATAGDADALGVRRSTRLMRVRRVTRTHDGRPIEAGDDRYAPETVTFEVHATAGAQLFGRA